MNADNIENLIDEIIKMRYNDGKSILTLVKYLQQKYDYSHSRSYEIVQLARAKVGTLYEKESNVLEDAIASLENMREDAIGRGESKLALEVTKELNKIKQLHIIKMEIDAKVEMPLFGPITISGTQSN